MAAVNCNDLLDKLLYQKMEEEPKGRKTRLSPKEDKLADHAELSGVKALFQMEDGRIYARYGSRYGDAKVMYQNAEEAKTAFTMLRKNMADKLKLEMRATAAGEDGRILPPQKPVTWQDLSPDNPLAIDSLAHGETWEDLSKPGAYITGKPWDFFQELVMPRQRLASIGPVSRTLVQELERAYALKEKLTARDMLHLERSLDGIGEDELKKGMRQLAEEGLQGSPELARGYQALLARADEYIQMAKAVGLNVEKLIDGYFPHVHPMRSLSDDAYRTEVIGKLMESGKTREEALAIIDQSILGTDRSTALQSLMRRHAEKGNPLSESEAQHILERYMDANSTMISGHLERERVSSIPPIEDARTAWSVAFARNARRIADAQVWGPNYERAYAMMDAIKDEGGDRAFQFAQKIFNLSVGREQNRLPEWMSGLMDWQMAKLSLSVISNMTQVPLNVPIRVGLGNTARGFLDFLAKDSPLGTLFRRDPSMMSEHAREAGAIVHGVANDMKAYGFQALFPKEEATSLLGKAYQRGKDGLINISTMLFDYVETANRAISVRAGERYFWQQLERLQANPEDAVALRRLREFFPSKGAIDEIQKQARLGNDGFMNEMAMVVGKRVSDETQFKTTALTRPVMAESPAGRVLYQFKQFSLMQADYMAKELMAWKHSDDMARSIRALVLPMTIFPAVAAAAIQGREYLMGPSLTKDIMRQAWQDPTFGHIVAAGTAAMLTTGTFGIMGDAIGTALVGNKNALNTFLQPPMVSSALNGLEAAFSGVKAAWNGDRQELERGIRAASRELGGLGSVAAYYTLGPAR